MAGRAIDERGLFWLYEIWGDCLTKGTDAISSNGKQIGQAQHSQLLAEFGGEIAGATSPQGEKCDTLRSRKAMPIKVHFRTFHMPLKRQQLWRLAGISVHMTARTVAPLSGLQ
ncbi:hypothetical protein [Devosia sp. SL43]|uniref:hypothetical protein n=1 Tax=Devosia sp. SL43 TaxID=2806348 RepID=UPI001F3690D3|nr:hypothetical protein [Devosia sp. SL43]UJW85869.1 hypothetical protein IM737_00775 [Devosia sp. SL43]